MIPSFSPGASGFGSLLISSWGTTPSSEEAIALFLKSGAYYVPTLSTVNGYIERIRQDPNAYEPAVRAKMNFVGFLQRSLRDGKVVWP